MLDLIVSVPDHCLSFYLVCHDNPRLPMQYKVQHYLYTQTNVITESLCCWFGLIKMKYFICFPRLV